MPEIIPNHVPSPRTLLAWDGTAYRPATIDAAGHLQIDVLTSGLPAGAATEATLATLATDARLELVRLLLLSIASEDFATQATLAALLAELQLKADLTETQPISAAALPLPAGAATQATLASCLTALQLIDDLRAALHSVNTDEVVVRGEDQLFSYAEDYREAVSSLGVAVGEQWVNGSIVPAGEVWVVTAVNAWNATTANTRIDIASFRAAAHCSIKSVIPAAAYAPCAWAGHVYLVEADRISVRFFGCVAGDNLYVGIHGYKMTKE